MSRLVDTMLKHRLIIPGVILLLLIIAGVGYSIVNSRPQTEPAPESASATPEPPTEIKPATGPPPPSLEQKIESLEKEIQTAGATGEPSEVTFIITEDEANTKIAPLLLKVELPEDIPLEIKSVWFDFQEDKVVTELTGTGYGLTATAKVTARANIRDGKPEVEITDISFGWLPLPESIKSEISNMINREIDELETSTLETAMASTGDVGWSVTDIAIQEEAITVLVTVQPIKTAN